MFYIANQCWVLDSKPKPDTKKTLSHGAILLGSSQIVTLFLAVNDYHTLLHCFLLNIKAFYFSMFTLSSILYICSLEQRDLYLLLTWGNKLPSVLKKTWLGYTVLVIRQIKLFSQNNLAYKPFWKGCVLSNVLETQEEDRKN